MFFKASRIQLNREQLFFNLCAHLCEGCNLMPDEHTVARSVLLRKS